MHRSGSLLPSASISSLDICAIGISYLSMADIINENCFEGRKVITGEKGALYADPVFPKNESDRSRIPTEKEIRDAIAEHLQVAYKGVRKRDIDYYFFEDD